MAPNLEDQLIDKMRALPPDKQQEALRLLETLATGASSEEQVSLANPFWEVVDELTDGAIAIDRSVIPARRTRADRDSA